MVLITTAALTRLQTRTRGYLTDTASILRQTNAPDGAGGQTQAWTAVHTGIPCMVTVYQGRKGGDELAVDARFNAVLWWRIDLPVGTDVTAKDRIQVGARVFEILSVGGAETIQVELMVMCTESVG